MSSAAGTTACRTCAKNADAHPGRNGAAQASEAVRKPKPVRPRPVAAKVTSSSQPQPAAAVQGGGHGDQREGQKKQGQLTEDIGEDDMNVEVFEGVSKLKPGKKSLRDAVNARLKSMNSKAAELARVDLADRKGNSLPMSAVKSSYPDRIKAWASDVVPSLSSCSSENGGSRRLISVSKASVPPSTIFSHSATTATSNVTSISSKAIPAKGSDVSAIPISDLVGGFGDEDIDDSYERQAASEVMKTGRQPVEPILQFDDVTDSESEDVEPGSKAARHLAAEKSNGIPPPATQPRQPHATQFASGMKRKLASGPSLKTVESFDDLEESSLASLSFGTQEPMVVDIKKASRTTSSTTIMTTDTKVPPAKKAKTALKVKTEQTDLRMMALGLKRSRLDRPTGTQIFPPLVRMDAGQKYFFRPSICGQETNQRLSEWRSNFGSTAIAIIIDFMAWNDDTSPSDLAEYLLSDFGFLYEDPDVIDKMKTFR
ncbi:uncharacterized protein HD556DRAFT_1501818 [Suillus plorans]|uniref:Uncharacterized protein n=1 Tax=Suillus plorans TaxID=116603 RepID=A0A9P7AG15_9AGAM|nr:uncharacterized protein HD556DRAFT_1501818 [Suillus plorans]KAG1787528.1 hypothetical protein HD556DRAFT_1501818 [Suillus plorans]